MYKYMYIYEYKSLYIHIQICIYIYTNIYIYIYTTISIYIYIQLSIYIYIYIYVYIYIYLYICSMQELNHSASSTSANPRFYNGPPGPPGLSACPPGNGLRCGTPARAPPIDPWRGGQGCVIHCDYKVRKP